MFDIDTLRLREFELCDSNRIAELLADNEVSKWTANIPHPYRKSDAEHWIRRTSCDDQRNPFAVEIDNQLIACVSYWFVSKNTIEVGYWVGRDYWGKGIATASLRSLLSSADFPNVSKVIAKTMKGNEGSKQVLLKCGFELAEACVIQRQGQNLDGYFFKKLLKP